MKEYNNNQQQKDLFYQEQTKERAQKAKEQNDTDISTFDGIFNDAPIKTSSERTEEEVAASASSPVLQ